MSRLISVIVPVYNVSKYLNKCIDSIIGQTYSELEILLIDDGSTDDSGSLCDEYAGKDSRIRVFHTENRGLSAARNYGLDNANGDFISFIDSDDYIEPDFYEIMLESIIEDTGSLAICDIKEKRDDSETVLELEGEGDEGYGVNLSDLKAPAYITSVIAMNKLYSRDIWEGLRYPVGRIHEDEYLIYSILLRTENFYYAHEPLYVYVRRNDSITGSSGGFSGRHLDVLEAYENRIAEARTVGDYSFAGITARNYLIKALELLECFESEEHRKQAVSMYCDGYRRYKGLLTLKRRLKYGLIYCRLNRER